MFGLQFVGSQWLFVVWAEFETKIVRAVPFPKPKTKFEPKMLRTPPEMMSPRDGCVELLLLPEPHPHMRTPWNSSVGEGDLACGLKCLDLEVQKRLMWNFWKTSPGFFGNQLSVQFIRNAMIADW